MMTPSAESVTEAGPTRGAAFTPAPFTPAPFTPAPLPSARRYAESPRPEKSAVAVDSRQMGVALPGSGGTAARISALPPATGARSPQDRRLPPGHVRKEH